MQMSDDGPQYPNPVEWVGKYQPDTEDPASKWNRLLGDERPEVVAKKKKQDAENLQREFAKNGLQWRVEDAMKAGIHPLAALGFSGPQASPVIVGEDFSENPSAQDPNASIAQGMGQDFSRAMSATASREQKILNAMQLASMKLDIEGKSIDNQIRASQLKKLNSTGPAMPSPTDQDTMSGQGEFQIKPSVSTASSRGAPAQQAGAINDYGFARTSKGGYIPVPSTDIKERIEDNLFHEATHFFRNNILPNFGGGPNAPSPRDYPLPKGATHWKWHHIHQQFLPARKTKDGFTVWYD